MPWLFGINLHCILRTATHTGLTAYAAFLTYEGITVGTHAYGKRRTFTGERASALRLTYSLVYLYHNCIAFSNAMRVPPTSYSIRPQRTYPILGSMPSISTLS